MDLNPIRAALAERLEESEFTGAKDRIDDLISSTLISSTLGQDVSDHQWERSAACTRSGWMSPIEIDERTDPLGPDVCAGDAPRRGSDKGFLPISLRAYLELVDWTGREVVAGKRGAVLKQLAYRVATASTRCVSYKDSHLGGSTFRASVRSISDWIGLNDCTGISPPF